MVDVGVAIYAVVLFLFPFAVLLFVMSSRRDMVPASYAPTVVMAVVCLATLAYGVYASLASG